MKRLVLLSCILWVVTACSPDPTPEPTLDPALLESAVQATIDAYVLTPPTLLQPEDGATFNQPNVRLEWEWIRPLAPDETFDVRIWREGEPHYGITWHRGTELDISSWLSQQTPGDFYWSITVIIPGERGTGEVRDELSQESPENKFTVNSTAVVEATEEPETDGNSTEDEIQLVAPPGFKIEPYTESLGTAIPTVMRYHEGIMHLLTLDGSIFKVEDLDGDDFAETITPIFEPPEDELFWVTGLEFYDDKIYLSDSGRISTLEDIDGDGMLDWETFNVLIEGLPTAPFIVHSNNSIVFYEDKLYVPIGSVTDHSPVTEQYEASIIRMDPDATNIEVIATGMRNPYEIAISPEGEMFTGDNSPDMPDKDLPYLPPEEINHIREGLHYGFPDYYGNDVPEGYAAPVVETFTSSATTGMVYYADDHFPEQYQDGLFVAQYGTASGVPLNLDLANGAAVIFVTLIPDGDTYTGTWDAFVQSERPGGFFRPTDVIVGPEGELFIAEATRGVKIQRVTWVGLDEDGNTLDTDSAQANTDSE